MAKTYGLLEDGQARALRAAAEYFIAAPSTVYSGAQVAEFLNALATKLELN